MKKIMHVNNTMNVGGIEAFIMNIYRNINKKEFEIVILTYNDFRYDYEDEIEQMGGKIIRISNPNDVSVISHIKELYRVIKNEHVDVVHAHTHFNCAYVMIAAKLAKVPIRISHSHSTYALLEKGIVKKIKRIISSFVINHLSTKKLACSSEAGVAMFKSGHFEIVPNGIDLKKYYFNSEVRNKIRKELNILEDEFVIGHVGRLEFPKNHKFLIEVFNEIAKENQKYKLVLVGSGVLENELKEQVQNLGIQNKVIFLGNRNDVDKLYNIFDLFVFPSIYEGFPVTLIEAQANGLNIIVSDNVSNEVKLCDNLEFLSIDCKPCIWKEKILEKNEYIRNPVDEVKNKYSIEKTLNILEKIYMKKD